MINKSNKQKGLGLPLADKLQTRRNGLTRLNATRTTTYKLLVLGGVTLQQAYKGMLD